MSKRIGQDMATERPTTGRGARATRGRKPASAPASKGSTTAARRRPSGAKSKGSAAHLLPFERVPLGKPAAEGKATRARRRAAEGAGINAKQSVATGLARTMRLEARRAAAVAAPAEPLRAHDTRATFAGEPPAPKSKGGAWPARTVPPERKLGPVAAAVLQTVRELRAKLGRKPSATDVAHRIGLSPEAVNAVLDELGEAGIKKPLAVTEPQKLCLQAILALEARHPGRQPSTREVSAEMGLSPSAARFHIRNLEALGLVTPPEVRCTLTVTPAGRALAT
jgi:Mn-dependent DtxR family transcriptional regulator